MDWEDITSFARYMWNAVTRIREWIFAMSNPSSPPETKKTLPKPSKLLIAGLKWEDADLPIDILLLTAKECEFLSCVECLSGRFSSFKCGLGNVYFGKIGNGHEKLKIAVIQCDKGSGGPQGSCLLASTGIRELKPKAVICVGYCAGLQGTKVKFGDVIISAKLATYASIKITEDKIIERGVQVPASRRLSDIIKSANFGWEAPLKNPKDLDVKVHKDALLLSGPEVVSNDERRAELLARFPDAMGVEMEGEGLFAAAHCYGMEWIVIKGVSDYAGNDKSASDPWRPFASMMAASLVAHVLRDVYVFQDWPHYEDK
ncbi:PREDICTED: 5'-methylthioadenosine/S-adenosylhomocysteine nucleosidase-like isoform X5 [Acropora digitifera]|uniref:5'-methylthioadenosine/S-adenosylhomocysteine nucleosidase-like isoform X5 n=1 Tax=Acropora digitifera TaxID=70779 RepID=UPI00077A05EB|nr:PREDICTED: 5'-methylthioadenosine/S-adenosylhomocysteine nucleosidase-like isoform X5 [Acropora digitifera]